MNISKSFLKYNPVQRKKLSMYFKHNMTPNAIEELLGPGIETGRYKNFHLHSTPTVVDNITVIPWICNQTKEEAYRLIHSNSSRFLFGHLQISGFEMDRGRFAEEGEEITGFTKYDAVLTGHFHHKSSYGSIHYLGSPYEMTWKDFDDPKGFHIFDTETSQLEYIENPYKIFIKLVYDDDAHNLDQLIESVTSCSNIKNAYAKVIIKNKNNTFWYDTFIDKITESGISDLQIVEDHYNLNISPDNDIICQAEDTLTILTKYIGTIDVNVDTFKLDQLLRELHEEAGLMRV